MKFFQGILAALVVILGGAYLYHTTTPEYALKIIQEALETKDRELLEEHFNLNQVTEGIIQEYVELSMPTEPQESRELLRMRKEDELRPKLKGLINMASDALLTRHDRKSLKRYQYNINIEKIDRLECSDSKCEIELTLIHQIRKTRRKVNLEMRKMRGEWMVTHIPGIAKEIKKVLRL